MAYNYYPLFPNYYTQHQGILWVQGIEGAKAYPVAPGASVMLMDSESSVFYIKSTNANGVPSMQVFDYVERKPEVKETNYVTREELEALLASMKKEEEDNAEPSI